MTILNWKHDLLPPVEGSLGDKFSESNGRPSGFDYMRILLAASVVCWHTIVVTYGEEFQHVVWSTPRYRVFIAWILPSFFILSGFLVAGSLERSKTISSFLYLRAIRIFPALIVEIALSALVLGPLLTTHSLKDYFSSSELQVYFLNCIGDIHYYLPGLFDNNPTNVVNGQLWTIPFELECYISLSILAVVGVVRIQNLFSAVVIAMIGFGVLKYAQGAKFNVESLSGHLLVMSFLIGVFFYLNRYSVPYRRYLGILSIVASLITCLSSEMSYLAPLPMAYATVFIGLSNPRRMRLLETGDYSYGIFLYGFPIQQAIIAIGVAPQNGIIALLAASPFIVALAVCSWHLWEKRMLGLRKYRANVDRLSQRSVALARSMFDRRVRTGNLPASDE